MPDLKPLTDLMAALRHPDSGCPWDLKQTPQSITGYTLEETHELLHSIETDDIDNQKEELGDLLFHIVFYAQMAKEQGQFDIEDVIISVVDKMTARHPHVFDDERDNQLSEEELNIQWQNQKQREGKSPAHILDEVGQKYPAMMRAQKLQDKAAEYYFDWTDVEPVLNKIEEEINELRQALTTDDKSHIQSEMGDILFACINLARHVDVEAELALRHTNEKFVRRFDYVVEQMQSAGIEFSPGQLDQMENFWQKSKKVTG